MKEKILALMKEKYKHLGLPDDFLDFQSEMLSKQVEDETKIEESVDALSDTFSMFQRVLDKRANDAVETYKKKNPDKDKGGKGMGVEDDLKQQIDDLKQKLELFNDFKKEIDTLKESVNTAAKNQRLTERNEFIAKVAKDLGLDEELTELAKLRLTDDMDNDAIDKSMCESKKLFLSKGFVSEDGKISDKEAALKKDAEDWLSSLSK